MISVIVPVYNAESTLERCLNSIAAQTYKDIKVIAVNDGSTDGSAKILKKFAKKDKRFTCVNRKHAGVSHARNAGLKYAAGEYLQFTDADDELEPDMFEKLITLMESNDADLAICRFNHPFFKTYVDDAVYDLRKRSDLLKLYSDTFSVVMPWNKIWRRKCFTEPFDENLSFSEDELCNLGNLPNVKRAVTCSRYLYRYNFAGGENQKKSAITSIASEESFWDNQTSFYYKGAKVLPKRRAYIQKGINDGKLPLNTSDDMAYLRLIDYCFWQMPAYIAMGIPENGLARECEKIFRDADFIAGFKSQQKYGFALKILTGDEIDERAKTFTHICYGIYGEKSGDNDFKMVYAFISVFLKLFADVTGTLNDVNQNAKFLRDLQNNSTSEARYVNNVC